MGFELDAGLRSGALKRDGAWSLDTDKQAGSCNLHEIENKTSIIITLHSIFMMWHSISIVCN